MKRFALLLGSAPLALLGWWVKDLVMSFRALPFGLYRPPKRYVEVTPKRRELRKLSGQPKNQQKIFTP